MPKMKRIVVVGGRLTEMHLLPKSDEVLVRGEQLTEIV